MRIRQGRYVARMGDRMGIWQVWETGQVCGRCGRQDRYMAGMGDRTGMWQVWETGQVYGRCGRQDRYVAGVGDRTGTCSFGGGDLNKKNHLEDRTVDG